MTSVLLTPDSLPDVDLDLLHSEVLGDRSHLPTVLLLAELMASDAPVDHLWTSGNETVAKLGYFSTPYSILVRHRTRSFFPGFFFFLLQNLDQIRTARVHATKVGLGRCL